MENCVSTEYMHVLRSAVHICKRCVYIYAHIWWERERCQLASWISFFLFGTWNGELASACNLRWSYDAWQTKGAAGRHLLINVHECKAGSRLGPFFFCHSTSFDDIKRNKAKGEAGRGIYLSSFSLRTTAAHIKGYLSMVAGGGHQFQSWHEPIIQQRRIIYEYVNAFILTHAYVLSYLCILFHDKFTTACFCCSSLDLT